MFSDNEVERESPSKSRGAAAAADSGRQTQSASKPRGLTGDEAEQQKLLEFLHQQQASLAALQEKKRRLESAQAEVFLL